MDEAFSPVLLKQEEPEYNQEEGGFSVSTDLFTLSSVYLTSLVVDTEIIVETGPGISASLTLSHPLLSLSSM